jgi:hypothetical protein
LQFLFQQAIVALQFLYDLLLLGKLALILQQVVFCCSFTFQQNEKVIIHRLAVVGGVDVDVIDALEGKSKTQDDLLNALKARIEEYKKGA